MALVTQNKVDDPYKALNLPHTATFAEIKKSYRELARQYHPDRLMSASEEEKHEANKNFSRISAAYSLLMDPQRKAQYDHVYKYGGYDDEEDNSLQENDDPAGAHHSSQGFSSYAEKQSRKRKQVGVGYQCTDPFAYLWTSGRVHSTTNVAGIQIPSRFQMATPGGGVSLSFSTAQYRYDRDGSRQFTSKTTQFAKGKKQTRMETTTIHKDGRKETIIQGEDFVERYTSLVQPVSEDSLPWYMTAFQMVQDNFTKCLTPCSAVKQ